MYLPEPKVSPSCRSFGVFTGMTTSSKLNPFSFVPAAFSVLKSVLASPRAYMLHTKPLPKGSLKYFNQFSQTDVPNLGLLYWPFKWIWFAFFVRFEWIKGPVVLILRSAMRFEPVNVRLNQKQEPPSRIWDLHLYRNVQESWGATATQERHDSPQKIPKTCSPATLLSSCSPCVGRKVCGPVFGGCCCHWLDSQSLFYGLVCRTQAFGSLFAFFETHFSLC